MDKNELALRAKGARKLHRERYTLKCNISFFAISLISLFGIFQIYFHFYIYSFLFYIYFLGLFLFFYFIFYLICVVTKRPRERMWDFTFQFANYLGVDNILQATLRRNSWIGNTSEHDKKRDSRER